MESRVGVKMSSSHVGKLYRSSSVAWLAVGFVCSAPSLSCRFPVPPSLPLVLEFFHLQVVLFSVRFFFLFVEGGNLF